MKYIAGLVLGATLGAVCALLFAPTSGAELRSNIKKETDTQIARAKAEWQKGLNDFQQRVVWLNPSPRQQIHQPDLTEIAAPNSDPLIAE